MNPILTHAIALFSGLLIGIFGNYFASRLTAKAEIRDLKYTERECFLDVKREMPELIKEMKVDLNIPDMVSCREFFILPSLRVGFNYRSPSFYYYENEHDGLQSKIRILEQLGFVFDITETNTPRYQFNENFVEFLLND